MSDEIYSIDVKGTLKREIQNGKTIVLGLICYQPLTNNLTVRPVSNIPVEQVQALIKSILGEESDVELGGSGG